MRFVCFCALILSVVASSEDLFSSEALNRLISDFCVPKSFRDISKNMNNDLRKISFDPKVVYKNVRARKKVEFTDFPMLSKSFSMKKNYPKTPYKVGVFPSKIDPKKNISTETTSKNQDVSKIVKNLHQEELFNDETSLKSKLKYLDKLNDQMRRQMFHYESEAKLYNRHIRKLNQEIFLLEKRLAGDFEKHLMEKDKNIIKLQEKLKEYEKVLAKKKLFVGKGGSFDKISFDTERFQQLFCKKTFSFMSLNKKKDSFGALGSYQTNEHEGLRKKIQSMKDLLENSVLHREKMQRNKDQVEKMVGLCQRKIKILSGKCKQLSVDMKSAGAENVSRVFEERLLDENKKLKEENRELYKKLTMKSQKSSKWKNHLRETSYLGQSIVFKNDSTKPLSRGSIDEMISVFEKHQKVDEVNLIQKKDDKILNDQDSLLLDIRMRDQKILLIEAENKRLLELIEDSFSCS
ncbi:hypothetical protein AB834_06275 [PVC group bacterium (ex Bugula neritina AB1)]|nr:hypothetical protein AB834_06275 [PVC group bacterium (ex Bugula neritina AB1)]